MYIFKCEKSGSLTHGVFEAVADFSPFFLETLNAGWVLSDSEERWSQRQEVKSETAFGVIGGLKHKRQTFKQCLRFS